MHDRPDAERRAWWLAAGVVVVALGFALGLVAGGEVGQVAAAGIESLPLFVLAALVQLRYVWRPAGAIAWLWFCLLLVVLAAFVLLFTIAALETQKLAAPEQARRVLLLLAITTASLIIGAVLAATPAWRTLARWLGARALRDSLGYHQGVVGLVVFILLSVAPFAATGGRAPLLDIIEQGTSLDRSSSGQLLDLFYGLAWTIPLAFLFAGVPIVRGLRGALAWLGVGTLAWHAVLALCGVAVALVGIGFLVDEATQLIWGWAGWPLTNPDAVKKLFEATNSPAGAVAVGVTAGVGEELMARGVLQPRFGWLLPNLAFAAAHAFQYGPDGVLSVFVVGGVQAAVRARWNTTGAAFTHGLYDFLLVLGGALGWPGF